MYFRLTSEKRMDGVELRWRPPSILFIPLVLCGCLIFFVDVFQLGSYAIPDGPLPLPVPHFVGPEDAKGFFIKTKGCRIPAMDPFDEAVKQYITSEKPIVCNKGIPPLVDSNLTSIFLLESSLAAYNVVDVNVLRCCYSKFQRKEPGPGVSDTDMVFNKKCIPVNNSSIINDEFVRVTCSYNGSQIYKDYFSFVPIRKQLKRNDRINILIIGIDSISRLNLLRQMPSTFKILREFGAVDMAGYNKIGDNTFPNLVAVLAGLTEKELIKTCWFSKKTRFDNCPFLWRNYSENGFTTAFAEDASWMGVFTYLKYGFKIQPTTYYWSPYQYTVEKSIGNVHEVNVDFCVGGRPAYRTLIQYIDKFTTTMHNSDIPYFALFWGVSLSHDYLNKPKLGDNDYANMLKKIQSKGILDNTALIFMSDHGMRWGGIRSTYQGRLEERLPFLFVTMPKSFREDYAYAYGNFKKNAKRLTTPFDLHETLRDLVNPNYVLSKEVISARMGSTPKRGYSLFEQIPLDRTCEDAGIEPHWCTCQQSDTIDKNNNTVIAATQFAIDDINTKLEGYRDCALLYLAEIYNARVHIGSEHVIGESTFIQDFTVTFRTKPGDAIFEVTVRQSITGNKRHFIVTGTISRINLYGSQSRCVSDFHLKLYCYCKS